MSNVIDSVSIKGMKQSDFIQLREIFEHVVDEEFQPVRWDRADYWDSRNKRLRKWLNYVNELLIGSKIKSIEN